MKDREPLPGEISPCAGKGDGDEPEREVSRSRMSRGQADEAIHPGEGLNEKDSHESCRLAGHCIRSLGNRGVRGTGVVKPRLKP